MTVSQDKFRGTEERGKSRNNLLLLGERLNLLRYKDIWLDTLHLIGFFFFFPSLFLTFPLLEQTLLKRTPALIVHGRVPWNVGPSLWNV